MSEREMAEKLQFSRSAVREAFLALELRRILEGEAAFFAEKRSSKENLDKINSNLAWMEEDHDNDFFGRGIRCLLTRR